MCFVSNIISANLPVHLQGDYAIDDGEAEHSDPAEQNAPEGARPEVHDEDLLRQTEMHMRNENYINSMVPLIHSMN